MAIVIRWDYRCKTLPRCKIINPHRILVMHSQSKFCWQSYNVTVLEVDKKNFQSRIAPTQCAEDVVVRVCWCWQVEKQSKQPSELAGVSLTNIAFVYCYQHQLALLGTTLLHSQCGKSLPDKVEPLVDGTKAYGWSLCWCAHCLFISYKWETHTEHLWQMST